MTDSKSAVCLWVRMWNFPLEVVLGAWHRDIVHGSFFQTATWLLIWGRIVYIVASFWLDKHYLRCEYLLFCCFLYHLWFTIIILSIDLALNINFLWISKLFCALSLWGCLDFVWHASSQVILSIRIIIDESLNCGTIVRFLINCNRIGSFFCRGIFQTSETKFAWSGCAEQQ